jgi:hypothetical protein
VRPGAEVWRISADQATRVEALDGAEAAALLPGTGVAAIVDDAVILGQPDDLHRFHFEAGPAEALSAGSDALWVVAGDLLYRRLDGEFLAAQRDGEPITASALLADAGGGVWAVVPSRAPAAARICHLRPTPPILVEGVHNLQRLTDETVEIAVQIYSGTSLASVRLDDLPLSMEPDGIGRWRAAPQTVGEGWHTLEVLASGSRGATARRLRFEQRRVGDLTFTGDIEPLFQAHCSGAACHGPALGETTRPDLSSYEAWIEREPELLERVVSKGDMPPFAARKDTWGLDQQLMVSEWFETGAARGDQ